MSDKTLVERLRESNSAYRNINCVLADVVFGDEKTAHCSEEDCNSCKKMTILRLADAIEREYLPRPRFDDGEPVREGDTICIDGELPLKVYWYSVRSDGLTVFSCPTSSRQIKTGERVKRPEQDALDADGVPIRKGDTVYPTKQNRAIRPFEVKGFDGGYVLVAYRDRNPDEEQGDWNSYLGAQLTHKQPDSLERIEGDAKKNACIYFEKQGSHKCYGCDKSLSPYLECHREMMLDLLRRQREVLERDHER